MATYYGDGDELHLAFNFPPLYARWTGGPWGACIEQTVEALDPGDAWPSWVLSNHDNPRHRTRYDRAAAPGGEDRATARAPERGPGQVAAAVLLLTLRGTPFLYQGEELGLLDAVIPDRPAGRPGRTRRVPRPDPVGRDQRPRLAGRRRRVPGCPSPRSRTQRNHRDLRA